MQDTIVVRHRDDAPGASRKPGVACAREPGMWFVDEVDRESLLRAPFRQSLRRAVDRPIVDQDNLHGRVSGIHAAVAETLSAFGRLDVLVNNAMWNRYEPIADVTQETFDRMTRIGLGGIVWGIQAAAPAMREHGGSIVNIGSMAGRLGSPNALIYAGVKAGVDGLTRSASIELGKHRIRVNAIAPSTIATEGVLAMLSPEAMASRLERSPVGRLGETRDIAETALWLASDRSSFINGQSIAVDGGLGHAFMP